MEARLTLELLIDNKYDTQNSDPDLIHTALIQALASKEPYVLATLPPEIFPEGVFRVDAADLPVIGKDITEVTVEDMALLESDDKISLGISVSPGKGHTPVISLHTPTDKALNTFKSLIASKDEFFLAAPMFMRNPKSDFTPEDKSVRIPLGLGRGSALRIDLDVDRWVMNYELREPQRYSEVREYFNLDEHTN